MFYKCLTHIFRLSVNDDYDRFTRGNQMESKTTINNKKDENKGTLHNQSNFETSNLDVEFRIDNLHINSDRDFYSVHI